MDNGGEYDGYREPKAAEETCQSVATLPPTTRISLLKGTHG
ncbi:hypothetical protein [Haladaptatus sp. NG-SE-30]